MKRKIIFSLVSLLILALFAGCSSKPYNYDLSKYITLKSDYKDIKINMTEVDAAVQKTIEEIENERSITEEVTEDRGAQEGDTVNINYKGKTLDDGQYVEGAIDDSEAGTDLVLGSGSMIDGFEDGIIGVKKGETVTLHLAFPESYHSEELAGRAIDFEITVNKISESTPGELTDEVASELTDGLYPTRDEYVTYLAKNEKFSAIEKQIYELSEFADYPRDKVEEVYNSYVNNSKTYALNSGMTLENYIKTNYDQDLDSYLYGIAGDAEEAVRKDMTVYYILRAEGKEVTEEDYDRIANEIFGANISLIESYYGKEYVENMIIIRFVCELVLEYAEEITGTTAQETEQTPAATETEAQETEQTPSTTGTEAAQGTEQTPAATGTAA